MGVFFLYSENMQTLEFPESLNFLFIFPKTVFCVDPLKVEKFNVNRWPFRAIKTVEYSLLIGQNFALKNSDRVNRSNLLECLYFKTRIFYLKDSA